MTTMDNGVKREREWLVWAFRSLLASIGLIGVGLIAWNLSYSIQTSVALEGVRMLVAEQGHRLDRIELWQDRSTKR